MWGLWCEGEWLTACATPRMTVRTRVRVRAGVTVRPMVQGPWCKGDGARAMVQGPWCKRHGVRGKVWGATLRLTARATPRTRPEMVHDEPMGK